MGRNEGFWLGMSLMTALAVYQRHETSLVQAQLDQAKGTIRVLRDENASLADASDKLKQQVDRFATENWRDVVPDAQEAAEEADTAKDEAQQASDDADTGSHRTPD